MKEQLLQAKEKATEYWKTRSKKQKWFMLATFILFFLLLLLLVFLMRPNYVPLYTNLSPEETGQIKETLDQRGIPSQLSNDGSAISVPEDQVDALKVELAAEGIPESGAIDYTFIEDQVGFGMTDNEFSVMERAAMQTELENLIQNLDGVENANVMITLPEESTWVSEEAKQATASIVLNTGGRGSIDEEQIRALYHLVSKSVPDLPVDNIVIMNERFEHFYYEDSNNSSSSMSAYEEQRQIQLDVERRLQTQIQQMLGTLMGPDKVLVTVTTDLDFTQENREEALVEPVDEENMEGIEISAERITETFEGEEIEEGGVPGAGEEDVVNYPAGGMDGNGDYERTEERINNEVNRIHREIVESPYKIRDIGIQVMVEPPDPEDPTSLPPGSINDIEQILSTIVATSIDDTYLEDVTEEEISEKIFVSSQPFAGKVVVEEEVSTNIPLWMYILSGVLIVLVIVLAFLLLRRRRQEEEELLVEEDLPTEEEIPDIPEREDSEHETRRKQLERLAREKPEEFSKLLRTWLSED